MLHFVMYTFFLKSMTGSFLRIIIALSTLLCAVVIICLIYGILFHHLVGFADYTIF